MKKTSLYASVFLILLAVAIAGIASHTPRASAQVAAGPLTGWGWSDTVGWISFNCTDGGATGNNICSTSNYSVVEDGSGNLTGYAWSDNIGWIKFGGLAGFPAGGISSSNAKINSDGTLSGWVQALAGAGRTDGWDGWISLSGSIGGKVRTGYGIALNALTGLFSGYSWGSDVVGWLTFNANTSAPSNPCDPSKQVCGPTNGGGATVSLTLGNPSISTGNTTSLSWVTANVATCSPITSLPSNSFGTSGWTGSLASISSGSGTVGSFPSPTSVTYTLNCVANAASGGNPVSGSATLTVTSNTNPTNPPGSCPIIQNATYCGGTKGTASTIVNMCPASSADYNGTCEFVCDDGFRQVGKTCVLDTTIQEN